MQYLSNFPDEILWNILEYLSPFDALYSFINLNRRFDILINPFKTQIDLTHVSYEKFMYYFDIILPIINKEESLYAMKLGHRHTPGQLELFNILIMEPTYSRYFNNITELNILSPRLNDLKDLIERLVSKLSNLISLSITIDSLHDRDFQQWTQLIVHSILAIPTLIKLSIDMPTGLVLSRLPSTLMMNSIVDLTLNVTLVTDLLILIQRIPNIEKLSIHIGWWTSGDRTLTKMLDDMHSNNNNSIQRSYLAHLKTFHLTIHSILTFQFEHLEQLLHKILNQETTKCFSFTLRQCSNNNNELLQLVDGQRWENLLSLYSKLTKFKLFLRIGACFDVDEEETRLVSFKSKYFREKKWLFSYFKHSTRDNTLFYSIPYKNNGELFDISLAHKTVFNSFPINYATKLLIDQATTYEQFEIPLSTVPLILQYFPCLEQLHLIHFSSNDSVIIPMNIPTLHTLNIERLPDVNLSKIMKLLPSINTLHTSFFSVYHRAQSLNLCEYNRISKLSVIDIGKSDISQLLIFLTQFPNLHFLHLRIHNSSITYDALLIILNDIVERFPLLLCLKLELGKSELSSVDWKRQLHGRVKMFIADTTFDGVYVHLWF